MTNQLQQVIINSALDMHFHFREGKMAETLVPLSSHAFVGGVVMPHLVPVVNNLKRLKGYTQEIKSIIGKDVFIPYMAIFFRIIVIRN